LILGQYRMNSNLNENFNSVAVHSKVYIRAFNAWKLEPTQLNKQKMDIAKAALDASKQKYMAPKVTEETELAELSDRTVNTVVSKRLTRVRLANEKQAPIAKDKLRGTLDAVRYRKSRKRNMGEETELDEAKTLEQHQVHKAMTLDKIAQMKKDGKTVDALAKKLSFHIAAIKAHKRGVSCHTEEADHMNEDTIIEGTNMTRLVNPKTIVTHDTLEHIRKYSVESDSTDNVTNEDFSYIKTQGMSRLAGWVPSYVEEAKLSGNEVGGKRDNAEMQKNMKKNTEVGTELKGNVKVTVDKDTNKASSTFKKGSWKVEGSWKKSNGKDAMSKAHNAVGKALKLNKEEVELEEGWVDNVEKIQVHHHGPSGAGVTVHTGDKKSTQHFPDVGSAQKYAKDLHKANGKMATYEDHTQ